MAFLDDLLAKFRAPARKAAPVAAAPLAAGPAAVASAAPSPTKSAPPPAAAKAKSACGPLRLAAGDHVSHYRERYVVVGTRYLENGAANAWHYCLRDASGAAAVLVATEGPDAACTLQRPIKGEVQWDVAFQKHEAVATPLKLARTGKAKVRAWDDAGPATAARSMEFREYADPAGDHVVTLEDYQGKRESRAGEAVFESELTFERAAERASGGVFSKAAAMSGAFEDAPDEDVVKGTPRAAARVLEQNVGATKVMPGDAPLVDRDPTAYDDDAWADSRDEAPAATAARRKSSPKSPPTPAAQSVDDDDEWSSAAQVVRGGATDSTS